MDFLSTAYLFKIQKASAILCLVAALFALIMNIILPAVKINFFNIIIHNLINNAIDAMLKISDIQTLTITTLKEAAKIIIIISDTGIGFKTVDKDSIVDITKIKSSDKSIGGYGLPYVVALVKQNNGEIIFRNKAAGGAEIRLNFKAKR